MRGFPCRCRKRLDVANSDPRCLLYRDIANTHGVGHPRRE
jgi:hypothetical protein